MAVWTDEEVDKLLEYYPKYARQGKSLAALSNEVMDRSVNSIDHKIRELRAQGLLKSYDEYTSTVKVSNQLSAEYKGEDVVIESPTDGRIRTLDQLKQAAKIDEEYWKVDNHIINKWEVAAKDDDGVLQTEELWQVKAWLKPNKELIALREFQKNVILDRIAELAPVNPSKFENRDGSYALELCQFDLHLGKYANQEQAGELWNKDLAINLFMWSLIQNTERAIRYLDGVERLEKFIFPIGNDFLHFDTRKKETSYGTSMAGGADGGIWQEFFDAGTQLLIWAIDYLSQYAPVEVVVVPGNHDEQLSYCMGQVIDAWYRSVEDVEVRNSAAFRKYVQFGKVLIGYTHGMHEAKGRLEGIMPGEVPQAWGETEFREWHVGHYHHRQVGEFNWVEEFPGIIRRVMPSLSIPDYWHSKKGFICRGKSAEAYLWDKERGLELIITATEPYKGDEN
jgi:hypothetical protein